MSFEPFNDDAWLERQMREVPLPPGLVARLKEIATSDDELFDAALRDVAMPLELAAKLRRIPSDAQLDDRLCQVPLPASLAAKLHGIAAYSDDEIDSQLNEVAIPKGLLPRLREISRTERVMASWRRTKLVQWAVAASLLLMVSAVFYGSMAGMVWLAYQSSPPAEPIKLESESALLLAFTPVEAEIELPLPADFELPQPALGSELAAVEPVGLADSASPRSVSEVQQVIDTFSPRRGGFDPLFNVFLATHVISASPMIDVPLPEVAVLEHHRPRGLLPPTAKQFDLLSLVRTGTHPFVSPVAKSGLETSQVPLVTDSWSYDHLWRTLRDGELPLPNEIFPEEFLAAIEYDFPPSAEPGLAIRTAAGPAPFSSAGGTRLLQVGVVASDASSTVRQVRYLTFAVDNSLRTARHGRLDAVRDALAAFVGKLGPRDRFSLVTFGTGAEVLLENAGREDLNEAVAAVRAVRPARATDFAAGLRLASDTALGVQIDSRIKRTVVLVTDSADRLSSQVFDQLVDLTADMHGHGANLDVLNLTSHGEADSRLARFATAGGGSVIQANDSASIRSAMMRVLTGSDQIVAREAQLNVKFNPKTVLAYRLIGHEPASIGGWIAGTAMSTMRAGETATALYEIKLKDGKENEIATVELTWHDPESKLQRKQTQPVSRVQLSGSLLESPLSLQRAALAAQFAEILRGSPFAPTHRTALAELEEMSYRMLPAALEEPSVERLLEAVKLALLVKSGRPLPTLDDALSPERR